MLDMSLLIWRKTMALLLCLEVKKMTKVVPRDHKVKTDQVLDLKSHIFLKLIRLLKWYKVTLQQTLTKEQYKQKVARVDQREKEQR